MPPFGENVMVILSSPSGVGKTTITKKLQQKYPNLKISISHTTRKRRSNEIDGIDYTFVSKDKFEKLIKNQEFYEYAKIFENYYGTLKKNIDQLIKKNDVLFDIDWQGTKQLSKFANLNLIKIYLLTDSKKELKKRLLKRDQNTKEEVEKRFKAFDEDVNLSEIEIFQDEKTSNDKLISEILEQISKDGFENTAIKFSISESSSEKGNLGWINLNLLSDKIRDSIKTLKPGQISEAIIRPESILFLKLNSLRASQNEIDDEIIRKNLINFKQNEQFNLYSRSHLSKLKNNNLIQYK